MTRCVYVLLTRHTSSVATPDTMRLRLLRWSVLMQDTLPSAPAEARPTVFARPEKGRQRNQPFNKQQFCIAAESSIDHPEWDPRTELRTPGVLLDQV